MPDNRKFVDYYQVLQVNPDCDARVLEIAYHHFAKQYHPDNPETADTTKFNEVVEAYRVLRNPESRAQFDLVHARCAQPTGYQFPSRIEVEDGEETALSNADMHAKLLFYLYQKRRKNAMEAGVVGWLLQEMLGCSEESFEFHVWYLKAKGYIEYTEQSTWAVTVEGVDHVIAMSQSSQAQKLLSAQTGSQAG